jgi:hypothetical protein
MSFEVRPVRDYRMPAYPAAAEPGAEPKAPMVANRASSLAPLAMIAFSAAVATPSATARAAVVTQDEKATPESRPKVQRLSDTEVEALFGKLAPEAEKVGPAVAGGISPMPRAVFLTETEARKLLEAFLKLRLHTILMTTEC